MIDPPRKKESVAGEVPRGGFLLGGEEGACRQSTCSFLPLFYAKKWGGAGRNYLTQKLRLVPQKGS